MNTEYNPLDPALEQAMTEIREDSVDPAVIEAAAARVWANLAAQCHAPLHTCADFQALIPEFWSKTICMNASHAAAFTKAAWLPCPARPPRAASTIPPAGPSPLP